ncbi:amidohydrolase family protein [Prosthecobacter sp.]|uniref:amidohydrolase family protein n=1 Tax=Prosthecobacter sp. TaxID=1965333 RepID=UPI002487874F|nr:amidohydrolase family protein [Prosthecobacter sp.]MDI1314573.1 amidohydrolase family protein [Prosthecobacter sp.]
MTQTRRSFLATTATALTGCNLLPASGKGNWIDAHVHVWTPDVEKYPLARGYAVSDMRPPSFTPEQLFAHCKPEGVNRIVLIQMSYYQTDNRYMLDMMRTHPGVFSGVGIVDEHAAGLAETMRGLVRQGVRGFRISSGKAPNLSDWLGSPGMATLWKTAAELKVSVCPLINPDTLPLLDKMCEWYPDTSVVVDHFARLGMAGPPKAEEVQNLLRLARHAKTHVKASAFYALGAKKVPYLDMGPLVRQVRDAFGPQRVMWASDCPFQVEHGHNYSSSIAIIRDRLDFLSEQDKAWMLRGTAEKVFFSAAAA